MDLVSQWRNFHIPPLALCRRITPKDDRITTSYTPWTRPSVTIVRNLYVHALNYLRMLTVPKSEVENSNILKLWKDSQGNGQFATDLQGHIQMLDSDPRTGKFHQTRVTAGGYCL